MKKAAGFTLIELVVVIALVVILAAIAIPAWRHMTSANRVTGAVNALAYTLAYARSEAIARGVQVTVCPSANATTSNPTCDKSGGWQEGWIVFIGTSVGITPIRVHGSVGNVGMPNTSPNTGKYIAFNRMGFAQPTFDPAVSTSPIVTIVACPPDKRGPHARAVILYLSGAVKTAAREPGSGDTFSCQ